MSGKTQDNVVLILGPESFLAERAAQRFVRGQREAYPESSVNQISVAPAYNRQTKQNEPFNSGQLAELAGSSLFAERQILVLFDLDELDKALFPQILDLAANPGDDLALVLIHPGGVKGKALIDGLKKLKVRVVPAEAVKAWKLSEFVAEEVAQADGRISATAIQPLIDAVGSDLRSLSAAVKQLLADADDGAITAPQINRYFAGQAEVTSFAVVDASMSGDIAQALEKLRWAGNTAVAPVLITSAFAKSLTSLGLYFEAQADTRDNYELARIAGVPHWKVRDLAKLAKVWRPAGIAAAIQAVAKADAEIKGGGKDPNFTLEHLVLQVHALRNASGTLGNRTQSS
ncbi:MAG: DNA polymerase III subunit delta [Propionibacteriaceae bacterium]|nr:DNA polymerase III subunit delta [Propionibacteriaceae bacterium]